MNRIVDFFKKYLIIISILLSLAIVLSMSYSNFIVTSGKHKAAEMYIGTLKYSMTIDGITTNTLSVPAGETIIDVTITNENPIDTYYKLIYQNNSNVSIKYYESTKDTNDKVTNYSSPNSKITSNNKNTIKLKIVNNSTSSQTVTFKIIGGFATNTLNDVLVPSGYTMIEKDTSTNTYFCTTTGTLTQGLQYVNGQYTYAYKQQGKYASSGLGWSNMANNGWGVQLTDKTSTDAVTSKVCTYINNKPIASMSYMFGGSQATTIDVSSFDTSKVTNMNSMFWSSQATTLDVSSFDTLNVTNMDSMFSWNKVTALDLSSFDTSNVTTMDSMFTYSKVTTLDLSNFDTSKVTNMMSMFWNSQATTLDVSSFDTSKVTNMTQMFAYSKVTTLDLSNFDTSKVTNMMSMFWNSQATALDVSSFDTSKVTNMTQMFSDSQTTTIDVSNFNTSNVTNMTSMFSGCQATTLDVSNFDTSKVTDMSYMFNSATNLKTIYTSDKFNTGSVTTSTKMFTGSTKLVGGAGTKYNSSYVDKTYARIDGGTSNPGYFTAIADKPKEPESFATDSWVTISNAVKNNNTGKYNVGDTKTIDMGTYGTHTLRIANKSTPSECSTSGFSQSACGFVVEFADIITTHNMNPEGTYNGITFSVGWNKDGWPASSMYTFVNTDIYNFLPNELRSVIIHTTIISSHGWNDTSNFTSTDKLYLLAPKEIYIDFSDSTDTAKDLTRTLDYYKKLGVTESNYSVAIKKNGTTASSWWLRAAYSKNSHTFYSVSSNGGCRADHAYLGTGVSPAFRIG